MKTRRAKKPIFYYELNAEVAKHDLNNVEMAKIGAMSPSTYSLKKNGKCPWLLNECKAYCEYFKRPIYGFFIPINEKEA